MIFDEGYYEHRQSGDRRIERINRRRFKRGTVRIPCRKSGL